MNERDLERLVGGDDDDDLEELPITPMDADPEAGRQPVPNRARTGRVATLKDRIEAMRARQAPAEQGPALSTESTSAPVLSTEPPAPPAQEQTVSTTATAEPKRITQSEAAAILGCTSDNIRNLRENEKIRSGLMMKSPLPKGGMTWWYLESEIRELARKRQQSPAKKSGPKPKVQRDTKPHKASEPAPVRAVQPAAGKPRTKARPRSAPSSPPPVAREPAPAEPLHPLVRPPETVADLFGPDLSPAQVLGQLGQLADAGIISRAKLDRVLAVLLEG